MRWLARIAFVFVLFVLAGASIDLYHTLDMLNALAEMAQRPRAVKDFQYLPTSLFLGLGWGLLSGLVMAYISIHLAVKLWPFAKRRPRVEGEAPAD